MSAYGSERCCVGICSRTDGQLCPALRSFCKKISSEILASSFCSDCPEGWMEAIRLYYIADADLRTFSGAWVKMYMRLFMDI